MKNAFSDYVKKSQNYQAGITTAMFSGVIGATIFQGLVRHGLKRLIYQIF